MDAGPMMRIRCLECVDSVRRESRSFGCRLAAYSSSIALSVSAFGGTTTGTSAVNFPPLRMNLPVQRLPGS